MEEFFYNQSADPIFWLEPEPNPHSSKKNAFEHYIKNVDFANTSNDVKVSNYKNMNNRMIEFLRRRRDLGLESKEVEKERCYKHMMSERMRRQMQKLSYSALHALLPPGTKSDKKTIVQVATNEITQLENYKEKLKRRKREIEVILEARQQPKSKTEAAKLRLRVSNPTSGINSMIEVLKCLKNAGSTFRTIDSKFSDQELSAVLEIGPEVEAVEVEKLVERTLFEIERKHPLYIPIREV